MVYLIKDDVQKVDFEKALKRLKRGERSLIINSKGGDFRAAMRFVQEIKKLGIEKMLTIRVIGLAGSAMAYVVFELNCIKEVVPEGRLIIHGGKITAEANELFDGNGCQDSKEFYMANKKFVREYFPEGLDEFVATNQITLSAKELLGRGAITLITQGRLAS